jgi:anaerobic dimethyl sulfoxide reductase subunit C (anchor subunit)
MKNRSLAVFTILSQMAVGAFLAMVALYQWVALQEGLEAADQLTVRAFLALVLVAALGMLASFFHLGAPRKAWRAFTNLRTSWLSREILFTTGFTAFGAIFVCFQWFQIGTSTARSGLAWIAAAFGIALVFSMAHVYMLPTISTWNTPLTMLSFYTTMLLLGGMAGTAMGFAMALPGNPVLSNWGWYDALRSVAILILVLICVQLLMTWSSARSSSRLRREAGDIKSFTPQHPGLHRFLRLLRIGLAVVGAGFTGLLLYPLVNIRTTERVLYAAFALVFLSELLGRMLFYEGQ